MKIYLNNSSVCNPFFNFISIYKIRTNSKAQVKLFICSRTFKKLLEDSAETAELDIYF